MSVRRLASALLASVLLSGCARALREPPPVTMLGRATAHAPAEIATPADVDRLLGEAEASFGRRPDRAAVTRSLDLFFAAARADETRAEGLLGAARSSAWLVEHERAAARRSTLATEAVQACQWCLRRAPANLECKYRLALALGQQARERQRTASDALPRIVALLEEVILAAPRLDAAGGHRVLGLLFLRAPGWPAGPGDPDAGLEHARAADALVPDHPANLLVLAEALAATGNPEQARGVYARAEALARTLAAAGDPDAAEWAEEAANALRRRPGPGETASRWPVAPSARTRRGRQSPRAAPIPPGSCRAERLPPRIRLSIGTRAARWSGWRSIRCACIRCRSGWWAWPSWRCASTTRNAWPSGRSAAASRATISRW